MTLYSPSSQYENFTDYTPSPACDGGKREHTCLVPVLVFVPSVVRSRRILKSLLHGAEGQGGILLEVLEIVPTFLVRITGVSSAMSALKLIRPFVSANTAIEIYNALNFTTLNYCSPVWRSLGGKLSEKLHK